MPTDHAVWYTTPRWRSAHLLVERTAEDGSPITLCGRVGRPDDDWFEEDDLDLDFRCGRCRRLAEGSRT